MTDQEFCQEGVNRLLAHEAAADAAIEAAKAAGDRVALRAARKRRLTLSKAHAKFGAGWALLMPEMGFQPLGGVPLKP